MSVSLGEIIVALTAILTSGGLFKFVQWAVTEIREARKKTVEEAVEAALQKARAEHYKVQSKATVDQKNAEIDLLRRDLEESEQFMDRLLNTELPRLQRNVDHQAEVIDRLSRSYEALSTRVRQ